MPPTCNGVRGLRSPSSLPRRGARPPTDRRAPAPRDPRPPEGRREARDWTPAPVTADERAEFRRRSLRSAGYDEGRPETEAVRILRRLLDRLPWPPHHRAFDALVPDTEGHLWVREDSSLSRWSVFDPDGRWLGATTLPAGLDVRQIGADYVLGIRTDELGVQEVWMHGLQRR